MLHSDLGRLEEEYESQRVRDDNPYGHFPREEITAVLDGRPVEEPESHLNYIVAMDTRAAARPSIDEVTFAVYEDDTQVGAEEVEKILDEAHGVLNSVSDEVLAQQGMHNRPECLACATVYRAGLFNGNDVSLARLSLEIDSRRHRISDRYRTLNEDLD